MGKKKKKRKSLKSLEFRYGLLKVAATELLEYLSANVGGNAEWPLDLVARDDKSGREVNRLFRNLGEAVEL